MNAIERDQMDRAEATIIAQHQAAAAAELADELRGRLGFGPGDEVPAGTPNRKNIIAAIRDAIHAAIHTPDRVAERAAALAQTRRDIMARRRAARLASSPDHAERHRVYRELRAMGFRRTHVSGRSAYYTRGCLTLRVSDHAVPMTAEREHALVNGGQSWASSSRSLVLGDDDVDEWLDDVRGLVASLWGDRTASVDGV